MGEQYPDISAFKNALVARVRREADRRDDVAELAPIDGQVRRAKAELRLLRDRIAALPADSLELFQLADLWLAAADVGRREAMTARETALLRVYGFGLMATRGSFFATWRSSSRACSGARTTALVVIALATRSHEVTKRPRGLGARGLDMYACSQAFEAY